MDIWDSAVKSLDDRGLIDPTKVGLIDSVVEPVHLFVEVQTKIKAFGCNIRSR